MTTPTPDREALLALAERKLTARNRIMSKRSICVRGFKRAARLWREAHSLYARALAGDSRD